MGMMPMVNCHIAGLVRYDFGGGAGVEVAPVMQVRNLIYLHVQERDLALKKVTVNDR